MIITNLQYVKKVSGIIYRNVVCIFTNVHAVSAVITTTLYMSAVDNHT